MISLGMRISQDGVDVKTGTDSQMVLTSKYSIFKGSIQGTGSTSVERDGTPTVVTIAHGLGYIPMVQSFFEDTAGILLTSGEYFAVPNVYFDGATQMNVTVSADNTNIYLSFTILDL